MGDQKAEQRALSLPTRPDFGTAERQLWRSTVADVTQRAKAAMDAGLHGRIDKACALVLAGDVELLPDGTARVTSQTNGTSQYFVVNGTCPCKDFPKAPQHFCKHRLAFGIAKRTQQAIAIAEARMAEEQASPVPPEAPATPLPGLHTTFMQKLSLMYYTHNPL